MKTDQAAVTKLLHQWDHGSKSVRSKILQDFIVANQGKTGPELELEFAHAASLFLTRLTAWLRLTYPFQMLSFNFSFYQPVYLSFLIFYSSHFVHLLSSCGIPEPKLVLAMPIADEA